MVDIKPFKAIRPRQDLAAQIASLPYDVVDRAEATELTQDNPYSYLHIDRSEVDLPKIQDVYAEIIYEKAAENLHAFLEKDWLIKDNQPYLYIYELTYHGQTQTGLVTTASVADYLDDKIKKHEFTRYDKEIDRIKHMDVTDANTSPVFLTYRNQVAIDAIIDKWIDHQPAICDFIGPYETKHRVWVIDDSDIIQSLEKLFAESVPALYIADGHHRTESAAKIVQQRKETGRLSQSGHYFLSVLFPINQLRILDYNRLVNVELPINFLDKLAQDFKIKEVNNDNRRPTRKNIIALYLNKEWYHLHVKQALLGDNIVDNLDASLVQNYIFAKYFDINDPREDTRLDFVGGIRGLDVLTEKVDAGEASFAIALYPTEKADLLAVADAQNTMPPKSTWFEPKLLSGLFIHDLESK